MKMIAISGVCVDVAAVCRIDVDEYVPLRFRGYEGLLGVRYLRFGNLKTSLLEFLLDPDSNVIRGLTLASFDTLHEPRGANLPRTLGLPIISGNDFTGPLNARRIDIKGSFSVGIGDNFLEADLGDLDHAQHIVVFGNVEFFVGLDLLVGVRVTGLTNEQVSMLRVFKRAVE